MKVGTNNIAKHLKPLEGEQDYPEPLQLLGSHDRPEFPLKALPPIIKDAVLACHSYTQAPLPLVVSCVLGILSAVCQNLILVRRDKVLVSPVSLILITIADSNERKTQVEKHFIPVIQEWEAEQARETAKNFNQYQADLVVFESVKAAIEKEIKQAGADGDLEELSKRLATHNATYPPMPLSPRLIQADSTKEATAKHLAEKYPSVAIISSEGGVVFGGSSLSQSSIIGPLAFYNSLWSNEKVTIDRSGDGQTILDGVALTMSISVQPEVLDSFLKKGDGMARGIGFFARALTCRPESTQGQRLYKEPESFEAVDLLNHRIKELLQLLPDKIKNRSLSRKQVSLSPEAKAVWVQYFNATEQAQQVGKGFEFVRDVAGKTADNAARIAGILHLIDNDEPYLIGDEISAKHAAASADIAEYYLKEGKAYFAGNDLPEETRHAQEVSDRIRAYCVNRQQSTAPLDDGLRWNEMTLRELRRKLPANINKLKSLTPILDELTTAAHIVSVQDVGRGSKLLTINPKLIGAQP